MAKRRLELLDRAQIEELVERSMAMLDEYSGGLFDDDPDDPEYNRDKSAGVSAALEGLRFAAAAIAWLGDPGLVETLERVVEEFSNGWELRADDHDDVIVDAIKSVIKAGAAPREVSVFAEHEVGSFRLAVAEALDVGAVDARAVLDALARDPDATVRAAATKKLSAVRAVHWWHGKFSRDPVEGLDAAAAEALKEPLQELSQLLDAPAGVNRSMERIAALLGQLPDAAALDGAEHVLRMFDWTFQTDVFVLGVMLARPGGSEAFLRLIRDPDKDVRRHLRLSFYDGPIAASFDPLSDERRDDLGRKLFAHALTVPHGHEAEHDSEWGSAARFASAAWPSSVALAPLLDALLDAATGAEPHGLRATVLREAVKVFERDDVSLDPVADRILQARIEGYPGPWSLFSMTFDKAISHIPAARVRVTAERCLQSENAAALTWGLQKIFGELHDPARDPPLVEMAARFYEDARYRAAMQRDYSLRYRVVPFLRRDLRAGVLDFKAAKSAMACIDDLWGGHHTQGLINGMLGMQRFERLDEEPPHVATERAKSLERHAAFLGAEEFHGVPTALEWTRWREARDRAIEAGDVSWRPALEYVPPGPALPEDRVAIDRALALWREGDFKDIFALAGALSRHPILSDLEVFDRLIRDNPDDRDMLKTARQNARWRLGLPPIPPRPEAAAKSPAAKVAPEDDDGWDDEDDEG